MSVKLWDLASYSGPTGEIQSLSIPASPRMRKPVQEKEAKCGHLGRSTPLYTLVHGALQAGMFCGASPRVDVRYSIRLQMGTQSSKHPPTACALPHTVLRPEELVTGKHLSRLVGSAEPLTWGSSSAMPAPTSSQEPSQVLGFPHTQL